MRRSTLPLAVLILAVATSAVRAVGPDPVPLWPHGAPDAASPDEQDQPQLRIYLPDSEKATGCGVVICPGGGYGILATDHEGQQIAKWFQSIGVAGFVLKYRHAPKYRHPTPLHDAQRAIRYVRAKAGEFHVSPHRIGIMGFSAGGHLASTAATHFDAGDAQSDDTIHRVGCRPDFAILGYPVISLEASYAHAGSRRNLLGDEPSAELVHSLSNETQVTAETPPTFLFHTGEDTGVPVANSLAFYQALVAVKVPAELHVYQYGPHGVGLAMGDPAARTWRDRLSDWLRVSGFLADVERAAVEGTVRVNGEPLKWGMVTFVPEASPNQPSAYAMVSRGGFQIPASRGAAVGSCRIEVHDLGAVEPQPTIEDAHRIDNEQHKVEIKSGANKLVVELTR